MEIVCGGQGGRKLIAGGGHVGESFCGPSGGFELLGGMLPRQTPIGDRVAHRKGRHVRDKDKGRASHLSARALSVTKRNALTANPTVIRKYP